METRKYIAYTGVGEDDDVAVADEVVDADLAMGGVELQVGDGVADGEPRHGGGRTRSMLRCDLMLACYHCPHGVTSLQLHKASLPPIPSRAAALAAFVGEVDGGLGGEVAPRRSAWAPRRWLRVSRPRPAGCCVVCLTTCPHPNWSSVRVWSQLFFFFESQVRIQLAGGASSFRAAGILVCFGDGLSAATHTA